MVQHILHFIMNHHELHAILNVDRTKQPEEIITCLMLSIIDALTNNGSLVIVSK
jgi:hypothetical protein